jgi:hypothetical protein
MTEKSDFELDWKIKAYFVYLLALYLFFYRLISNSMMTQMDHPVFLFGDTEWFYQLLIASHIPQFITSNSLSAALFDISLLVFSVLFLLTFKRIYAILFTVSVVLYFCTYNIITGHHYHGMAGMIVISLAFWLKEEERFKLAWEAARYYFLYIFASAALWKILRGSAFYQDQLSNILKSQQLNLLLQNPNTLKAHVVQYLIANPGVSHMVLLVNVLVQLSFIAGFFTKKYDRVLLALAIIFCIANYFVMSIISAELLILGLTLLNWDSIKKYLVKIGVVTV